jgi:hypothetical protein
LIWRVVLHPRIPDGLGEVQRWTLPDLLAAHVALDTIEEIDRIEHARQERKQKAAEAAAASRRRR